MLVAMTSGDDFDTWRHAPTPMAAPWLLAEKLLGERAQNINVVYLNKPPRPMKRS